MSFCPKCGREIVDESLGCPICSVKAQSQEQLESGTQMEEKAEEVHSFTVEDAKGTYQRFESKQSEGGTWSQGGENKSYEPVPEQGLHPALKVIIIVLIILVGGIGAIAGLIAGIILMKSPIEDNQKFGKIVTIVSAVMLALSLICCLMGGFLYTIPFLTYY